MVLLEHCHDYLETWAVSIHKMIESGEGWTNSTGIDLLIGPPRGIRAIKFNLRQNMIIIEELQRNVMRVYSYGTRCTSSFTISGNGVSETKKRQLNLDLYIIIIQ